MTFDIASFICANFDFFFWLQEIDRREVVTRASKDWKQFEMFKNNRMLILVLEFGLCNRVGLLIRGVED